MFPVVSCKKNSQMLFSLGKLVRITAMATDISVSHSRCFLTYLIGDFTGRFYKLSFIMGTCQVITILMTMSIEDSKEKRKCP